MQLLSTRKMLKNSKFLKQTVQTLFCCLSHSQCSHLDANRIREKKILYKHLLFIFICIMSKVPKYLSQSQPLFQTYPVCSAKRLEMRGTLRASAEWPGLLVFVCFPHCCCSAHDYRKKIMVQLHNCIPMLCTEYGNQHDTLFLYMNENI